MNAIILAATIIVVVAICIFCIHQNAKRIARWRDALRGLEARRWEECAALLESSVQTHETEAYILLAYLYLRLDRRDAALEQLGKLYQQKDDVCINGDHLSEVMHYLNGSSPLAHEASYYDELASQYYHEAMQPIVVELHTDEGIEQLNLRLDCALSSALYESLLAQCAPSMRRASMPPRPDDEDLHFDWLYSMRASTVY